MILTCPSCSAKFMISSTALGAEGREVRCGKCSHSWFQEGERDSLDELSSLNKETVEIDIESVKKPEIEIDFTPHVEEQAFPKSFHTQAEDPKPSGSKIHDRNEHIAGAMVALAIVSVLMYGFVALRAPLAKTFPSLERSYAALGFVTPSGAPEISFDRLKIVKNGDKTTGTGYIINLTEKPISIKSLSVDLINTSREVISTQKVKLATKTLKAESSEKIEFTFDKIPENAQSVRVYTTP